MDSVLLIFPHQLNRQHQLLQENCDIILVEEYLFFNQYAFHKQKLAFHRASMKSFDLFLQSLGKNTKYIEAHDPRSDVRLLIPAISDNYKTIHIIDPTDDWLEKRIRKSASEKDIAIVTHDSSLFLNQAKDVDAYFKTKNRMFQTSFYKDQRLQRNILLDKDKKPLGGKWTYDAENRKKYPKKKIPPSISYPESNEFTREAKSYILEKFPNNPGHLDHYPLYPIDEKSSKIWFEQFLTNRFAEFGPYEDAIVSSESILHHSVLSPLINTGLLAPDLIINRALHFGEKHQIPINTIEGFIRQILGWREFIRAVYQKKGVEERTKNYWGFTKKIPASFYTGTTGILPIDQTIKKVLQTGYCHHIERLMILGNFMLLCEFDPNEVYQWFMELFIDAYDWVMVPNVYGMSQFADGGLMATKPYISGSNYVMKMSNYKKGNWQKTWDGLFWRFMHVHRDFFLQNPRLGMLVRMYDKMPPEKQETHLLEAESYLSKL